MPTHLLQRRLAAPVLALLLAACDSPSRPGPEPQERAEVAWLRANAHPISLNVADRDFSDLQPLRTAIGDARVVMLGEQSHGDGTTFLAKARLVAFLHQEMGFDVLAWESGLWEVAQVWRQVQAGHELLAASRRGIFTIWSRSEQVLPTLDYVAGTLGTARPLELAGFDNQFTGSLSDSMPLQTEAFARRIGSAVPDDAEWPAARETLRQLASNLHYNTKPTAAEQERMLRLLAALRTDAAARGSADREALLWAQVMESVDAHARATWATPPNASTIPANDARDAQMGRNLVWLANVWYPGRKIIVWAASSHIARDLAHLQSENAGHPFQAPGWSVHMGAEAYPVLGTRMYAIGFTAAEGSVGRAGGGTATLPAPREGSVEEFFVLASMSNAFVDFRSLRPGGEWLRDAWARPFGYSYMLGDWTRVFDGMIYTRSMTPSTLSSR